MFSGGLDSAILLAIVLEVGARASSDEIALRCSRTRSKFRYLLIDPLLFQALPLNIRIDLLNVVFGEPLEAPDRFTALAT